MQFLDWFVKEQGEEETNATDLIKKMELFGSDPKGLYMLDQELAARTYAAPSLTLWRPVRRAFLLPALDGGGRPWYTGRSLIPRRFPDERPADRGG